MDQTTADYTEGDVIHFTGNWTDAAGNPADPTNVALLYQVDGGQWIQITYNPLLTDSGDVIHDGTGEFHCDVDSTGWVTGDSDEIFPFTYEWAGEGAVQVTEWKVRTIRPRAKVPTFS